MDHHAFIRPADELAGPAIRLIELIEEEGPDTVLRAVAAGLNLFDFAPHGMMAQRQRFDLIMDVMRLRQTEAA